MLQAVAGEAEEITEGAVRKVKKMPDRTCHQVSEADRGESDECEVNGLVVGPVLEVVKRRRRHEDEEENPRDEVLEHVHRESESRFVSLVLFVGANELRKKIRD